MNKIKENKYLIDWNNNKIGIFLVLPSYKAINGDIGYYWDFGISVSTDKKTLISIKISFIFGWLRITIYKNVV